MSLFWILVDRLAPLIAIVALLGPFVWLVAGVVVAKRRVRGGERASATISGLQGFGLGVVCAPVLLWLAMCTPPPGEGVLAREGMRRGAAVLGALKEYRRVNGDYPDLLAVLAPRFLSPDTLARPTASRQRYPWEYKRLTSSSFVLSFRYVGPAMNTCELVSTSSKWQCSEYF